ncbi:Hypothetical predicted protein, partial [Paramuricea clavata]
MAEAEMEEEDFDLILSLDDAEKDDKTSPVIRQSTDAFTINEVIAVLERISSSTIKSEAEIAQQHCETRAGKKILPPWIALYLYLSRLLISAMVR